MLATACCKPGWKLSGTISWNLSGIFLLVATSILNNRRMLKTRAGSEEHRFFLYPDDRTPPKGQSLIVPALLGQAILLTTSSRGIWTYFLWDAYSYNLGEVSPGLSQAPKVARKPLFNNWPAVLNNVLYLGWGLTFIGYIDSDSFYSGLFKHTLSAIFDCLSQSIARLHGGSLVSSLELILCTSMQACKHLFFASKWLKDLQ